MTEESAPGNDPRPVVRTGPGGKAGVWAFVIGLAIAAWLLFEGLNAKRLASQRSETGIEAAQTGGRIVSPAPLDIGRYAQGSPTAPQRIAVPPRMERASLSEPQVVTRYIERPQPPVAPPERIDPALEADPYPGPRVLPGPDAVESEPQDPDRVRARPFTNPSLTVPKGTIIASVLETALDSTRPGFARAMVTRDVYGFDGSRVLIPRGSKLLGEYQADIEAGQKRALVVWQRLMRPDGVMIELASPSADPLGRTGIKGDVDTHFFQRFGGAILQSILDIGVNLATQSVVDDTVIVALPGSATAVAGREPAEVRPTLKVRHGASVSVFVAKDLDFSSVDI